MLQYSTRDIINKARQLADLENSDFISYSESLTLLNEAYTETYQKAIDCGDLFYIKRYELEDTLSEAEENGFVRFYPLPNDFFQLYSVQVRSLGRTIKPLSRHVKDESTMRQSYEVKNNCLVIYGAAVNTITVEYFPVPRTLYVKREDFPIEVANGTPVAYFGDSIIIKDETSLRAIKISTNEQIGFWDLADKVLKRVLAGENGIVAFFEDGSTLESDFGDTGTITEHDTRKAVREDNGIFLDNLGENIAFRFLDEENSFEITTDVEGNEYLEDIKLPAKGNIIDQVYEGRAYIIDNDGSLVVVDPVSKEVSVDKNRMEKKISMGNFDLSTGYGVLCHTRGQGYAIKSQFEDTALDYPNNFFFTLLAYSLAMSYKTKQNGDVSLLSTTYAKAENDYYDTLHRDSNAPLRMNNIYV